MRKLILLGASGNIGEQTLKVLANNSNYSLVAFSVGKQTSKINEIVSLHPEVKAIYIKNEDASIVSAYPNIKFYFGDNGLVNLINDTDADIVLNALVGFVGLAPTLASINKNMDIALANKETLVVGGELVNEALRNSKSKIYPVDSEHSAIYKCLKTCKRDEVKEILITASGGALRNLSRDELNNVTVEQALHHPTWRMGNKVTIDSASMLNKGFELIEAFYLFNFPLRKYKVLMHDESYVHSIVRLKNGSYIGEVNAPSMMNPIAYALSEHNEIDDIKKVNNLNEFGPFHFNKFNSKRYPMVKYALKAIKKKGTMPCVINAVDEVAVEAFLNHEIKFLDIEELIRNSFKQFDNQKHPSLETLIKVDQDARAWAKETIKEAHL